MNKGRGQGALAPLEPAPWAKTRRSRSVGVPEDRNAYAIASRLGAGNTRVGAYAHRAGVGPPCSDLK